VLRDSKKTLSQNYRNIGLVAKLGRRPGGVEKKVEQEDVKCLRNEPLAISPGTTYSQKSAVEVRLEIDPETGNPILARDTITKKSGLLNDPLNDPDDSDVDESKWNSLGRLPKQNGGTGITDTLESLAASGVQRGPRKQSQREQQWIQALVERHGDNYGAMFRDVVLNPMQQSEGDIKRRVTLWKKYQSPGTNS
jgi:nucleolar protein 16